MRIVVVCGLGVGSSLMLKMTIQDVLDEESIRAKLESTDIGSAKGMNADIYVLSSDLERNTQDFSGIVVVIKNITDVKEVREKLLKAIQKFN